MPQLRTVPSILNKSYKKECYKRMLDYINEALSYITYDFLFLFQKRIQISFSNGPTDQNIVLGKHFSYILSSEMRH